MSKFTNFLLYSVAAAGLIQAQKSHGAYYIATDGSDSWSGLLPAPNASHTDGPFATLPRAQVAMQRSSIKTVYIRKGIYYPEASPDSAAPISRIQHDSLIPVAAKKTYARAGTYHPPSSSGSGCLFGGLAAINLTSADSGETWSYYPPDGYNSAILDGGASDTGTRSGNLDKNGLLDCAFAAEQALTFTIDGLQFQNWWYGALYVGSNGVETAVVAHFTNNIVHDSWANPIPGTAVQLSCPASGSTVSNNAIYNMPGEGIVLESTSTNCNISGVTIANNFLLNTCEWVGDCGAIYTEVMGSSSSGNSIANNYVRDVHKSGLGTDGNGIYHDAGSTGINTTGNVITGIFSYCAQIDGNGINFTGNLCDIGTPAKNGNQGIVENLVGNGAFTNAGPAYTIEHNIVVAGTSGTPGFYGYINFGSGTVYTPVITNNAYWNYVGSGINSGNGGSGGPVDANPVSANPQLSCWAVTISGTSPALNSPVSFPGITGGWGPPGFTDPKTGTPPSWPHGC